MSNHNFLFATYVLKVFQFVVWLLGDQKTWQNHENEGKTVLAQVKPKFNIRLATSGSKVALLHKQIYKL
jgi:hypothetical protein